MSHVRTQIRAAVKARLLGLRTTGNVVHTTQIYSVPELPALLVYTFSETSVLDNKKGRPIDLMRTLELRVEGLAATADGELSDTLDRIASEVETAMVSDLTFGGLALRTHLTNTEFGFTPEGEKQHGMVRLTYQVVYRTAENDPETTTH